MDARDRTFKVQSYFQGLELSGRFPGSPGCLWRGPTAWADGQAAGSTVRSMACNWGFPSLSASSRLHFRLSPAFLFVNKSQRNSHITLLSIDLIKAPLAGSSCMYDFLRLDCLSRFSRPFTTLVIRPR